jgi:spore coat polysaccharide biosynthesis predicted glycosyltransferase SpsG
LLRILLASSSVGLGHIVRDRVLAYALSDLGFDVEVLCSEPALSYARHWGLKIHRASYNIESLSKIYSEYYLSKEYGGFSLSFISRVNKVVNMNKARILEEVVINDYEAIIADESWELMKIFVEKPTLYSGIHKILITDFLFFKPTYIAEIPSSILLNIFLRKSYRVFDTKLYVGLKTAASKYGFIDIGPLPSALKGEMLGKNDAKKILKLDDRYSILFSMGGTAGGIDMLEIIIRSIEIVGRELKDRNSVSLIIAPGSEYNRSLVKKILEKLSPSIDIEILEDMYSLPKVVKAFDIIISPAGLGIISLMISSGVPGIIFPLKRHFEQEENARIAPKIWEGIRSLEKHPVDEKKLASLLKIMLRTKPGAPPDIYKNVEKTVNLIKARISSHARDV